MRKNLFISTLFFIGLIMAISVSCETDPLEYCEQDDVCGDGVDVEVCCTDDGGVQTCVWKYEGNEYTDVEDIMDVLGCASGSASLKSAVDGPTREEIRLKLTELMERAHAGLYGLKKQ